MNLPFLADRGRCATPKHAMRSRLDEREATKKADVKKGCAFRAAVWKRADSTCEACGRKVRRTLELSADAGHVDHTRGRRVAPADVFNPDKARLLCGKCHLKKHGQRIEEDRC